MRVCACDRLLGFSRTTFVAWFIALESSRSFESSDKTKDRTIAMERR